MPHRSLRSPTRSAALRRASGPATATVLPVAAGRTVVLLPGATDLEAFRREARALLQAGVPPAQVQWHVADAVNPDLFAAPDLFAGAAADGAPEDAVDAATGGDASPDPFAVDLLGDPVGAASAPPPPAAAVPGAAAGAEAAARVPPAFLLLCRLVILHRDPGRFGLLYRLLWRLVHEPGLRRDPLDADRMLALQMARAVRRDMHKMKAFVRFRTLHPPAPLPVGAAAPAAADGDGLLHVAWFEPAHHIAAAVAPFFVRRFTGMRWAILTPDRSLRWDGARLEIGPGASRRDAPPADAGEALWLTYYAHIFNPARLKLAAMQREMPRRYWHGLPEAALIAPLAARAAERTGRMLERGPTVPARRIPQAPAAPADKPGDEPAGRQAPALALHRARPDSLMAVREAAERCRGCGIGDCATRAVPGEGPARARLALVGEQPGDQEDLRGRPFVGPAGQLLDRALRQLGWDRTALYLTNAVKHFKFEVQGRRRIHRSPVASEIAACRPWLEDELRLVRPEAVVALGATAARAVLGRPVAVGSARGQWLQDDAGRPVLVTLHPAALLRADPAARAQAYAGWLADLRMAAAYAAPAPSAMASAGTAGASGFPVDSRGTSLHLPTAGTMAADLSQAALR
ncbi:MAG: UdgX family uracil-DNA binding protein [Xylophilus ampelinus]